MKIRERLRRLMPGRSDRDLESEMRFHLDMEAESGAAAVCQTMSAPAGCSARWRRLVGDGGGTGSANASLARWNRSGSAPRLR